MITARADFGGGPEHLFKLVEKLSSGIEIFIACPKDFPYWDRYAKLVGEDRLIEIPHRKFTAGTLLKLFDFISSKRINIIHSHGKGAGVYSRLISIFSSARCVHTLHGLHIQNYNGINKKLYLILEKLFSLFTTRVIAVSKGEADLLLKHKLVPEDKLRIIENSVDITKEVVSEEIFNSSKLKVVTISRFDFSKNTSLIIPVAEELMRQGKIGSFEFIILGSGPDELEIQRTTGLKGMSNYIIFEGFVTNPKEFLIKSFCYISTSRWEGMPLGVLEAMSVGLPVIATNVVGNNDAVKHGITGFLYDIEYPESAADYLIKLAGNRELWRKLSQESRLTAERRFSAGKMADETKKIYLEILNKGKD